jgi:hypothetical protein
MTFNFDRTTNNYTQLGAAYMQDNFGNFYVGASPDGALVYFPNGPDDFIGVFDASHLASNQPALITNLASFHQPQIIAVSPVLGSDRERISDAAVKH